MTISFSGSAGSILNRIGRLAGRCADVLALKGGPATTRVLSGASFVTAGTNILADAAASPSVSPVTDGVLAQISAWQSSQNSIYSQLATYAQNELVSQVDQDAHLATKDVPTALAELIRQMNANSASINSSSVSAGSATGVGSPTGTPTIVSSMKNAAGLTVQTPFPETLRLTVTADAPSGTATARNEPIYVQGQAQVNDVFSHLWPAGSGRAATINVADSMKDNTANNLLANSCFEAFSTSNYPDNWIIQTGTAGTQVLSSTTAFDGVKSLEILGDGGSTLTSIAQPFNTQKSTIAGVGGSPAVIGASTQFAVSLWTKVSSVPSAGVLQVALTDGSGTVLQDAQGANCSFTISLPGETSSWANHTGVFRTPAVMPAACYIRLKLTTAIDSAKYVLIDSLAMTPMVQLYPGGPSLAAFAGATNVVVGDAFTVAISSTPGVLAQWMERFFSLNAKNLVIPNSGSPSCADSVVS